MRVASRRASGPGSESLSAFSRPTGGGAPRFAVLFAISELQLDHNVPLLLPGAGIDRYERAGDVDDLFLLLVLHNQAIDLEEQRFHKVICEVPSDNLLSLLAHGGELLDHSRRVLLAYGILVQPL